MQVYDGEHTYALELGNRVFLLSIIIVIFISCQSWTGDAWAIYEGTSVIGYPSNSHSYSITPYQKLWLNVVTNPDAGSIALVNSTDASTLFTITGLDRPTSVAIDENAERAYVVENGTNHITVLNFTEFNIYGGTLTFGGSNPVSVISIGRISLPANSGSTAIDIDPITKKIYVANRVSGTVTVIDENTNNIITTISGFLGPKAIKINPSLALVYVANGDSNTVSVIDELTDTLYSVHPTITVENNPVSIGINPVSNYMFVANNGSSSISEINMQTLAAPTTIPVGTNPVGIGINTCRNETYVSNRGSNSISIINMTKYAGPSDIDTHLTTSFSPNSFTAPGPIAVNEFLGVLSTISYSATNLEEINIGFCPGPKIISITASSPVGGSGFGVGAKIYIKFDKYVAFNTASNKIAVDSLFSFSQLLGNNYNATGGQIVTMTIIDPGTANPTPGVLTITPKQDCTIYFCPFEQPQSVSSPTLMGSFSFMPGPDIWELFASGNNASNRHSFSAGDDIFIQFTEATNQPLVATKSQIDALLAFSQSIGNNYVGSWLDSQTLQITIEDPGTSFPNIGSETVTVLSTGHLKSADLNSDDSISTSPPMEGTFAKSFVFTQQLGQRGTIIKTFPDGITTSIFSSLGGGVSLNETSSSTVGPDGKILKFIGSVKDISINSIPSFTGTNVCGGSGHCAISFILPKSTLTREGFTSSDIKIFHDAGHDGSFIQSQDVITPTVTSAGGDLLNFTVSVPSTSKFAIGGVAVLALLGAGSEGNAPLPPSLSDGFTNNEYPLTIDGNQFKLPTTTNLIPTVALQNYKPVEIKLLASETGQGDDVEGMTLFTNLYGNDPTIANADTAIAYQNGSPLQIIDPHGFFKAANCTISSVNGKFLFDFTIVFAKPMPTSDMAIRMWDKSMYTSNIIIVNATKVEGILATASENYTTSKLVTTAIIKPTEEPPVQIPFWIKNNAKWWHDGKLDDAMFLSGIQYLIDNKIIKIPPTESLKANHSQVPAWIKNDAGWWSDGSVSDQEFVKALEFLVSQRIIKV